MATKDELRESIRKLRNQLHAAEAQLGTIEAAEWKERELQKQAAREKARKWLRGRITNRDFIKQKLEAIPHRDLNKITSENALGWLLDILDCNKSPNGLYLSLYDLTVQERCDLLLEAKETIHEIREDRKQAWLANH